LPGLRCKAGVFLRRWTERFQGAPPAKRAGGAKPGAECF